LNDEIHPGPSSHAPAADDDSISVSRLIGVEAEAHAFWRMRVWTVTASVKQVLETSRLRVSLLVFLSIFFWIGLFCLFYEGFHFLSTQIGHASNADTVRAVFNVFFVSLMAMLLLSSAIILYSGLFGTPESAFLLTTPARAARIVLHKFQEAIFFSCWGFILLGSPMLIAYGVEARAPWYYFALLFPFMLAFVYIPGALGGVLCLLVVRRLPRLQLHLSLLALLALAGGVFVVYSLLNGVEHNLLTGVWFQEMLGRLQISEHRLFPSWWLSSGLLEAASADAGLGEQRAWAESLMFLSVLVSNALVCHLWMVHMASRHYRTAYSELVGSRPSHKPRGGFWLDRLMMFMPFLSPQMRLLIVKDLRIFRRDPVQWSQFLIFFALLSLYFMNIRRFSSDVNVVGWVNMISFLNLAVIGLILSTFTTRFIFPMISLEGRRFWILNLLPIERDTILWSKFLFASVGSAIPCVCLIMLSDVMLQISWLVVALHQLTCLMLCLGLSGIAVGLGAMMPNLQETSPSKIAAGFGGTLNLVVSAIYIVAVVLLTALPSHYYLVFMNAVDNDRAPKGMALAHWLLIGGTGLALTVGIVATVFPLRRGLRAFRRLEL
jgi:ABC-2 type transport system permease protein